MARRRRKKSFGESSGSLDLFLDALCNAFGGIIFIALLVCVLLQMTGRTVEVTGITVLQNATEKNTLTSILADVDRLKKICENQKDTIKNAIPVDPRLYNQYVKLIGELDTIKIDIEKTNKKLDEIPVRQGEVNKGLAVATKSKGKLEGDLRKLEAELDKLKKRRKDGPGPEERETEKKQIAILLSGGRLRFLHRYSSKGKPLGPNMAEVKIKRVGNNMGVFPKPMRGMVIDPGSGTDGTPEAHQKLLDKFDAQFAASLAKFTNAPSAGKPESQCHYFMIAVWPDSYAEFELLRDLLVKKGFKYGLIIMEKNKPVMIGGGKGKTQG